MICIPNTEDFNFQLRSVADQWLKAVEEMNGSATPWNVPFMNYRGWYLSKMEPHTTGVVEPEAAGAIAWLLYNAFKETGDEKYRIGAEWAMEFLNGLNSNPSYELQLSYGAYIAAKMNAELGSEYDIEKIVNWCFDVGPLRNWGAIVGNWGGLDVSGLIGEVNGSNDYAFLMNTFEQAAALVPLVKYDDRFSDAIGKWMLNAANASRLFYTNYLPDFKQDSEEWSYQYDPRSYIGHEALRESRFTASPYATGDAIEGGWGATNLALYGSSHVGIFGGIIDTTNIKGILKLDLNKTDFFSEENYPCFLIYNPYEESKNVVIDFGQEASDVYEMTSNSFIASDKSGEGEIAVPAKSSISIVLVPSGSNIEYNLDKTLANGVVIDYSSGRTVSNYPPRIKSLAAKKNVILKNETINIYCTALDLNGDSLRYTWTVNGEILQNNDSVLEWASPENEGEYLFHVEVEDESGAKTSAELIIEVKEEINSEPNIQKIEADPRKIDLGASSKINCIAEDLDGDSLTYFWSSSFGMISSEGKSIEWEAPAAEGNYFVTCEVSDGRGGIDTDSIELAVRDLSIIPTGNLISYYPFNGNADDAAGDNNGIVSGAVLLSDRFGNSGSAYFFDGDNDFVRVTNSAGLNFQSAITINFWMNINSFFDREQYPISHGNWERRWKVSVSGDRLRWTIKTANGITDLDSETILESNKNYNVTALYSGADMEIYINGKLDAFKFWSGNLEATNMDLTIGQATPSENQYNFNGILDDIRIYDYALPLDEIKNLYDIETSIHSDKNSEIIVENFLFQNYPNPFNSETIIKFQLNNTSSVKLELFDFLGQKVKTLMDEEKTSGIYSVKWDGRTGSGIKAGSGIYFLRMQTGNFRSSRKMVLLN